MCQIVIPVYKFCQPSIHRGEPRYKWCPRRKSTETNYFYLPCADTSRIPVMVVFNCCCGDRCPVRCQIKIEKVFEQLADDERFMSENPYQSSDGPPTQEQKLWRTVENRIKARRGKYDQLKERHQDCHKRPPFMAPAQTRVPELAPAAASSA